MGSAGRKKPEKLGMKLKVIRDQLGCSYTQMSERLSDEQTKVLRTDISRYEKSLREPSLVILLRYARLANVSTDLLIDDMLDL